MSNQDTKDDMIAKITAAYATRPDVTPEDIVNLISKLKNEIVTETSDAVSVDPAPVSKAKPALPINEAITQDKVYCLCCGKGFKMLKRHLGSEHGLTEAEYRRMFDLPDSMPLVAPSYSEKKAAHAKEVGLGNYSRDTKSRNKAFS